ncbi:hypothetical protein D3C75_890220 [compost metagenome]
MMMPNNPKTPARSISGNRSIRMAIAILKRGMVKDAIPVNETTITIGAETIPAWTAACPITSAPRMLTAWPTVLGRRMPASRRASKATSIINASTIAGKGMVSRATAMDKSRLVGSMSWWKVVTATYKAGKNSATALKKIRSHRIRLPII